MPSTLFPTRGMVLLSCVVALVGCATVDVVRVKDEDYVTKGLRYWLPAPYVIVKAPVEVSYVQDLAEIDEEGHVTVLAANPLGASNNLSGPAGNITIPNSHSSCIPGDTSGRAASSGPGINQGAANPSSPGEAPGANKTPAAEDTAPAPNSAASNDAIAIVWLPDYCQQYAINQSERGASTQLQLTFADGWQLTSYNAQMNSTEVFNKMVDALASVVGTAAKAAPKAAAAGMQAGASAVAKNNFSENHLPKRLFLRTTTAVLTPGVYPLFTYPADDCSKTPKFCSQQLKDALRTSVTWEETAP
jgi:hypothetical protein